MIDKSSWPRGPWINEPDFEEFEHCGLACKIIRNDHSGTFCGYVGVSSEHPLHDQKYTTLSVERTDGLMLDVHGGLTFSGKHKGSDLHWFGFDCNHSCDIAPGWGNSVGMGSYYASYRDIDFVRYDVKHLAEWLSNAEVLPESIEK